MTTLSPQQKREITEKVLKGEYKLYGDRLALVSKSLDYLSWADTTLSVGEVAADLAGFAARWSVLSGVSTFVGAASIVLFPVGAMISLVNAWETGERLFGFESVSHTTTAWAFKDLIPQAPPLALQRVRSFRGNEESNRYKKAWEMASRSTVKELEMQAVAVKKLGPIGYRALLKALGNGNRFQLCVALLRGFESRVPRTALAGWKSSYTAPWLPK